MLNAKCQTWGRTRRLGRAWAAFRGFPSVTPGYALPAHFGAGKRHLKTTELSDTLGRRLPGFAFGYAAASRPPRRFFAIARDNGDENVYYALLDYRRSAG